MFYNSYINHICEYNADGYFCVKRHAAFPRNDNCWFLGIPILPKLGFPELDNSTTFDDFDGKHPASCIYYQRGEQLSWKPILVKSPKSKVFIGLRNPMEPTPNENLTFKTQILYLKD